MNNELMHYGVPGMKWGVRHDTREYGMSKHRLKKKLKKSGTTNQDRVESEYFKELHSNKKYNELGEESNRVAKDLIKSETSDFKKDPYGDISNKTRQLYKKHSDIDLKMTKIERDVGKKYLQKFNDARLDDILYSGSKETGRKMLEKYGKAYIIRGDGVIEKGSEFTDSIVFDYDKRYQYIRPRNL